ncbi:MAG: radical SAM protein [bacterium]|nr:radical SAM protein [bacterium]
MTDKIKALFVVPPLGEGDFATQTDAVLARCAGIYTKTDYVIPPIGLAYTCAAVEDWGDAEVNLIDAVAGKNSPDQTLRAVKEWQPDILYVAVGTSTLRRDLAFLKSCKNTLPNLITVVMGTHVTVLPGDVFAIPGADVAIMGEPERTVAEVARAINADSPLDKVNGLALPDGEHGYSLTPPRALITNIDDIPHPARRFLNRYSYSPPFAAGPKFDTIITSRGCPYECNYCSTGVYFGKKIRFRSTDDIMSELTEMVRDFGVTTVGFWDDTFTIGKRRVLDLCNTIVESDLDCEWMCMARVDTVDAEMLEAMRRAGCYLVLYGVESGSQKVLDTMKKGITIEQTRKAFAETYDAGIEAAAFFMMGNLGETEEDIKTTIEFARDLKASYASFNIATPYPGTELYEEVKDELAGDMEGLNARRASFKDSEMLERYISRAYREFYLRPSYVWWRLRRARTFGDLIRMSKAGIDVVRMYLFG